MNNLALIKKLIRRHRQELTATIGAFRVKTLEGVTSMVHLDVNATGKIYTATVTRGEPDWLCVNDSRGASVASLY
jgi:hypothetical protein